ncbi:MAG: hypothetical protein A2270_05420 [Elusimicrobia bacterium RIFOXYA12_FULL_51_18]|nr:MAG: hypothetical protein A2270_05420 [Elusimicrobia bacterium RIFOXYA12_FULL_51_18]OGS28736.1 MAG: hypothetical protein A2218_11245 [Elusimicrobia bacterium RIFOXYA2_FULL_53_38]
MRILITGICGYLGFRTASFLADALPGAEICGLDNISRRGSESNLAALKKVGAKFYHGDIRVQADVDALPPADWLIDCAANPTVLAGSGVLNDTSSRQLMENNLSGTINLLEYCKRHSCGLVLLSTSRVYSISDLLSIKLRIKGERLEPVPPSTVLGFSKAGVSEDFSTRPPLSLYGTSKAASELLALEYSAAFGFPVWINRCGVIGGPGQFGRIDQGILSFWAYSKLLKRPLKFIGYSGRQVRDCMDASDVAALVMKQITSPSRNVPRVINAGGGLRGSFSLRELDALCSGFLGAGGPPPAIVRETRPYDVPYYVTDYRLAEKTWDWKPSLSAAEMVERICRWASDNESLVGQWFG